MEFEKSEILKNLPKQFFANLVIKVNKKILTGFENLSGLVIDLNLFLGFQNILFSKSITKINYRN